MIGRLHYIVAFCLALHVVAAQADPVKIRIGWIAPVSNLASILFMKDGIARHNGASYTMDAIHFQGSPTMITALASGDLDIALLGFSSLPLAVQNGGLADLRIIADELQDGAHDHYSNPFFVLKDGPVKSFADLKGKTISTNTLGSGVDIAMRAMLEKQHIDPKKDTTTVEAAFPNMKAMLIEQKIFLMPSTPPFSEDPQLRAAARVLFTQKDAMGVSELAFWAARTGFIGKNRAALTDFLEDYLRMVRWYTDPANHATSVEIAARATKAPAAVFDSWLFTDKDFYRNPDGLPDLAALQANVDLQYREGFLKAKFDAAKYIDLGMIKEAAGRLSAH